MQLAKRMPATITIRCYQGSNLGYGKIDFKIPSDNHYTIEPMRNCRFWVIYFLVIFPSPRCQHAKTTMHQRFPHQARLGASNEQRRRVSHGPIPSIYRMVSLHLRILLTSSHSHDKVPRCFLTSAVQYPSNHPFSTQHANIHHKTSPHVSNVTITASQRYKCMYSSRLILSRSALRRIMR